MTTKKFVITSAVVLALIALAAVLYCFAGKSPGQSAVAATAEGTTPLQAGDMAPTFSVRTVDDEPFMFDPGSLVRPTVLISVRGGWCPYCNTQLSELRHVVPELADRGFDVLFLSNDPPNLIYDGLKEETRDVVEEMDYTILSDADVNAGRAFGTAFVVSDEYIGKLDAKGHNYSDSSIDRHKLLAVPSVYLIDASGEIVFAYANPNYKVRLSPDDLMAAADALNSQ